jgi:hypothetical protein
MIIRSRKGYKLIDLRFSNINLWQRNMPSATAPSGCEQSSGAELGVIMSGTLHTFCMIRSSDSDLEYGICHTAWRSNTPQSGIKPGSVPG